MQMEISGDEAEILAEVLDKALGDIREEVYKAEVADYKEALKRREAVIEGLIDRLRTRPAVT
jgi:hypothetical protein